MAPVTGSCGETDPLCIAQAVSFEPAQDSQANRFKSGIDLSGPANWHHIEEFDIKCKLRNRAGERATSADTAKNLEGFAKILLTGVGIAGVGASLNTWQFSDGRDASGCTKENKNQQRIMLMRRDSTDTHNLWHKLREHCPGQSDDKLFLQQTVLQALLDPEAISVRFVLL